MEWFVWPSWIGTPSQFGLLILAVGSVTVAWFKIWPRMKELGIGERQKEREDLLGRIRELRDFVTVCEKKCDDQAERLQGIIDGLRDKITNEALQRMQSEISLVNTLIEVVDAPQLRAVLHALEAKKVQAAVVIQLPPNGGAEYGERSDD